MGLELFHGPQLGAWVFAGLDRWLLAVVLFVVAAIVLWITYRGASFRPLWVKWVSLSLKLMGFGSLIMCLLEPEWVSRGPEPGANLMAILADNSLGMDLMESGESVSRSDRTRQALEEPWIEEMEQIFQVRRYAFDAHLRRVQGMDDLDFQGTGSRLAGSLAGLKERYEGQPLAGVMVFSDGNATDHFEGVDLEGIPPVYPVLVGSGQPGVDLGITNVTVSQTSFEEAPVGMMVDIRCLGAQGDQVTVTLEDADGKRIDSREVVPSTGEETSAVRFSHRPPTSGVSFYRLRISRGANKDETEATLENNVRYVSVNRGSGPYRVLYVSGRPNWEYKFLQRSLKKDAEVDMVGLIRIAKREPKFQWRGRSGESSNPLFRGFEKDEEDQESYDQPVLVRMNTKTEEELAGGFPKEPEELFGFRAVIIDDLEAEFFTPDQMEMLERFVSKRGGGLLMLGGQESFAYGGYENTPIASLLPVYVERLTGDPLDGELRLDLTREGWLQPWVRLREERRQEEARLAVMGTFQNVNRVPGLKPGASVIANVFHERKQYPALVAQRYGDGRAGAMLVGDMWRWGFKNPGQREDMEKAWRQTVRWMISDVPDASSLEFLKDDKSRALQMRVVARDEAFVPIESANVVIVVTDPEGKEVQLTASAVNEMPGVYSASFIPKTSGLIHARARISDADGEMVATADDGWATNFAADEFASLAVNRAGLERLADETGGRVLEMDTLGSFVNGIKKEDLPVVKTTALSLWHTPVMFFLALIFFGAEWALRRQKGLA